MKLRFQLVRHLSSPLPRACQLPEHYPLDVASDREAGLNCGKPLRRVRTSTHYPQGLMLGRPRVRLIHKQCSGCQQVDSLEACYQDVPPGGNYAYDLIVEVGLARLRDHRQDGKSNVISSNAGDGRRRPRVSVCWPSGSPKAHHEEPDPQPRAS